MRAYLPLLIGILFLLPGCVSRDDADDKLIQNCVESIKSSVPPYIQINDILSGYAATPSNKKQRLITITAFVTANGEEEETQMTCLYEEKFSLLHTKHSAHLIERRIGRFRLQ